MSTCGRLVAKNLLAKKETQGGDFKHCWSRDGFGRLSYKTTEHPDNAEHWSCGLFALIWANTIL